MILSVCCLESRSWQHVKIHEYLFCYDLGYWMGIIPVKTLLVLTDILASELRNNPSKEADTLYEQYHTNLSTLINKHAPPHTKYTKAKYIPGWVNKTMIAAKETKHLFECIWRRNKSTFNRSQYMQKVHHYNKICMQAKCEFRKAKIWDNHHNPQKLWRVLADVLHRIPAKKRSSHR